MNIEILIPIVIIIGCIILIIIKNPTEHFKSEYRESDIILPNPIPTFISDIIDKKEIIINNKDNNNSYPLNEYELKIDPPQIDLTPPKKDEAYHDDNFIRDNGVNNAMKKKEQTNNIDYTRVIDSVFSFNKPQNSHDLLTNINIKNISKDELQNSNLADIYNKMTAKVINDISPEQIDNITGKPIIDEQINGYYKPVLSLIDQNLKYFDINDIDYKYKAFEEIPMGSLIK